MIVQHRGTHYREKPRKSRYKALPEKHTSAVKMFFSLIPYPAESHRIFQPSGHRACECLPKRGLVRSIPAPSLPSLCLSRSIAMANPIMMTDDFQFVLVRVQPVALRVPVSLDGSAPFLPRALLTAPPFSAAYLQHQR